MKFAPGFPLLALSLAAFAFGTPCASAQTQGIVTLAELRNLSRPLLLFAPKPNDPQLEIQLRTLEEHAAETQAHNLVPIAIPYQSPSPTNAHLTEADAESIRRRFHVAPSDFAVILLDKDGHELLRSTKPLSMRRLDERIDSTHQEEQPR